MPPSKDTQLNLAPEMASKYTDFKKNVADIAEDTIFNIFPAKILQLQALIDESKTSSSSYYLLHAESPSFTDTTVYNPPSSSDASKKRKIDEAGNAVVPSANGDVHPQNTGSGPLYTQKLVANTHIRKVHEQNKEIFQEMIDLCDKVKLWINLTMPRIEDGDNFGVQIQEEVLNELTRAQESAYALRDNARAAHLVRAKICSKLVKYPNIEDYIIALRDHDEKQLFMARQNLHDARNMYAILFDILQKNIQKIRAPKGNNNLGMY